MKKQLLFLVICLSFSLNSIAQSPSRADTRDSVNDGPYFYFEENQLKVRWIENNAVREYFVTPDNFTEIKENFHLLCSFNDLKNSSFLKPHNNQSYKMIDSIGVITDIHGEYNSYLNLLKAMGIIDNKLNWKFGSGHLVVLGDIFDRGDMVTEIFWHLFGLEKQAVKEGGMVHLLLGNHELMTLSKDLDYMNEKYKKVSAVFNTNYFDLYSEESVLGKWLRSKPVALTINDIIFVHAGISDGMIQRNIKIKRINRLFSEFIVGKDLEYFCKNEKLKFLDEENGPLWYRGYFTDPDFCESRLDSILTFYDKKHIVVGHTTNKGIISLFNNKILGADAGIVNKQPGEMLICKNGIFYRGTVSGKRIKL
jgi:hypothetical protein